MQDTIEYIVDNEAKVICANEKYSNLIVFNDKPQRQLEMPDCHNNNQTL